MKRCPIDNAIYPENMQFCRSCGTLLVDEADKKIKCFLVEIQSDRIFELSPTEICTIGRLPENTIVPINERYASRYHARIVFEAGKYVLYDGGTDSEGRIRLSTSGVFVNGGRCDRCVLSDGCQIELGQNKFIYREESQ